MDNPEPSALDPVNQPGGGVAQISMNQDPDGGAGIQKSGGAGPVPVAAPASAAAKGASVEEKEKWPKAFNDGKSGGKKKGVAVSGKTLLVDLADMIAKEMKLGLDKKNDIIGCFDSEGLEIVKDLQELKDESPQNFNDLNLGTVKIKSWFREKIELVRGSGKGGGAFSDKLDIVERGFCVSFNNPEKKSSDPSEKDRKNTFASFEIYPPFGPDYKEA